MSKALPSLKKELVKTLTLICAAWLSAVFITMAFGIHHEVEDILDDALQESAEVLYGILTLQSLNLPLSGGGALPAPAHKERLIWQVVDQQTQVVLRSHDAPATAVLAHFKAGFSDSVDAGRIYGMQLPNPQQLLYVCQPGLERLEARFEAIISVAVTGLLVGLVCALWVRRRVDQAMQPFHALSDLVKNYDPMLPETDLPPPAKREFVEIREAIVNLGRRLARRAASEQAFAAHAAHALRTPLAGMEVQLAIAMKEASEQARPRLERTREAMGRLKRVVTSLLALFRSSAEPDLQDVNLAELVSRLPVDALQVHVSQASALMADPNLLAATLSNLLDNALRYGARNCWITCHAEESRQYLTVRDDGPGISAERCAALKISLDQPVDEGFLGLGLKLAALVAKSHHGQLVLDCDLPGQHGFSVTLVLWLDAPPGRA
ncbi:MAG: sensor histidine kinase [Rhodoferax sp.]